MRVLHIIDIIDAKAGGAMRAVLDTCRELNRVGVQALCIATSGDDDDLSHLSSEYSDIKTLVFKRSFPVGYSNSDELINWLEIHGQEFDLVEIHCIFSVIAWRVAWFCYRNRIPYLVMPHSSLDPHDLKKHRLLKMIVGPIFVRIMLEKCAAVLLTATLESERLNTFGAGVNRWVIPLPVHLPDIRGERDAFRKKHGIPSDALVILFLSRIDPKKGLQFLIPAIEKVKNKIPNVWFVLAGGGERKYENAVTEMIVRHGIGAFTTITGFLRGRDKADAFAASDLFVLPSLNENFGIVNIEAMNSGLPILISKEVYIYPEVEAAGAGIVCDPESESVANELFKMLCNPTRLREMGKHAQNLVKERYLPGVAIKKMLEFYNLIKNNYDYSHGSVRSAGSPPIKN